MYDKNLIVVIIFGLRPSGIEPEEQDWKSGMLPLHHERVGWFRVAWIEQATF